MNSSKATLKAKIVFSSVLLCTAFSLIAVLDLLPALARTDSRISHLTHSREGRLAVFDDVWETIYQRYYDPAFKGVDWSGRRSAFRRAAAEAKDSQQLYQVLRSMIGALNDPHTRVFPPEEKSDWWHPRYITIGLSIREIEGHPTVVRVEPKSEPARAGLKPGDQIQSIDGVSVSQLLEERLGALRANSSQSARSRMVSSLFDGEVGTISQVSWKGKDGKLSAAAFTHYWSQRELGFQMSRKGSYLVVEIETFTQALAAELVRSLRNKIRGAKGLVLDLRANGGGDAAAMAEVAAVFLGGGIELGGFRDRVGVSFELRTHPRSIFAHIPVNAIKVPIIVLIGERTSSAAEILASVLQSERRARLLGSTTCGCVLAIRSRHALPDEGVLDVSEFDYRTAKGIRLEGLGVQPEDTIAPQRQDLYAGRDRVLEQALELLKVQSR